MVLFDYKIFFVVQDEKDLKCINSALEAERNRLLEFIKTLQKRLDNTNTQLVEQEAKLIEQKKLNNRLEKDIEKAKLDLNNVKNRAGNLIHFQSSSFVFSFT